MMANQGNTMDVEILGTSLSGFVFLGNLRTHATWSHRGGMVAVQLKTQDLTTAHLIELRHLAESPHPFPIGIPGTQRYHGLVTEFENEPDGFTLHIATAR